MKDKKLVKPHEYQRGQRSTYTHLSDEIAEFFVLDRAIRVNEQTDLNRAKLH